MFYPNFLNTPQFIKKESPFLGTIYHAIIFYNGRDYFGDSVKSFDEAYAEAVEAVNKRKAYELRQAYNWLSKIGKIPVGTVVDVCDDDAGWFTMVVDRSNGFVVSGHVLGHINRPAAFDARIHTAYVDVWGEHSA